MNFDIDDMSDIELEILTKKLAKRAVYLQYLTFFVGILGIAVLSLMIHELLTVT